MREIGFEWREILQIIAILAAILHIGDIVSLKQLQYNILEYTAIKQLDFVHDHVYACNSAVIIVISNYACL